MNCGLLLPMMKMNRREYLHYKGDNYRTPKKEDHPNVKSAYLKKLEAKEKLFADQAMVELAIKKASESLLNKFELCLEVPASFQLKQYAKKKGISFDENISMIDLRDLIDGVNCYEG